MLGHHKNPVAFCSTTWMQVLSKPTWHFVASCKVFLCMQLLKTTWAFCSKWYVLVCAVIENEGVFCSKGKKYKSSYVKVVEMNGRFVAKAIFGKSGAQQPHSL